jgi:hypothetical protein
MTPDRNLRVLVIANEVPVPTNSGGRVDVWRRAKHLKDAGAELALLSWRDGPREGPMTAAEQRTLEQVFATAHVSTIARTVKEVAGRLALLPRFPSHVASRWLTTDKTRAQAWARSFAPDLILLDGLYGVAMARHLSKVLGLPWVMRSHNIEHRYMHDQRKRASGWTSRLGLTLACAGLERTERAALRDARHVFDISSDDAAWWRTEGVQRVSVLPPMVDEAFARAIAHASGGPPRWDVLYFGNLNTPNNVDAVEWFVTSVLPRLQAPQLRVAFAGSHPSPFVQTLLSKHSQVELIANPESMAELVGQARVLINPVRSGSGVNLKSVEMLFSRAHLVSTSTGIAGMPSSAKACFTVADTAEGFAQAVDTCVARAPLDDDQCRVREQAAAAFSARALSTQWLDDLWRVVAAEAGTAASASGRSLP